MIAQNVRSEVVSDRSLVSASMSGGTVAKRAGQTNGFQDIMDRSLTKEKQESNPVSNHTPVKKKDTANAAVQNPEKPAPEKTDNTPPTIDTEKDLLQMDDTGEVIKEQLGTFIKSLQDILGLSTEELVELMTQMGFGVTDLCNQDNLMKLLLVTSDSDDPSSILTDETMAGKFQKMLTAFNETTGTLEEEGISELDLKQWLSLENEQPEAEPIPQTKDQTVEMDTVKDMLPLQTSDERNVKDQQAEPIVEVIHKGEAVENLVKAEPESEPLIMEEEAAVSAVHTKDTDNTGASEADVLLEKKGSTNEKDNSASMMKDKEPKTQFESFMDQLTKNSKSVTTEVVQGQNGSVTTVREIVNQVVSKIRMVIQPDMSSMELQLNPENLGRVQLSVAAREGEMTAHFAVQNETAKAALESQIQLLRENLNNQGLKVEAIEVTVSDFSFAQSNGSGETADSGENSRGHSRRQMNLDDLNDWKDELSEEEEMAVKIMKQNGGSIDYTA